MDTVLSGFLAFMPPAEGEGGGGMVQSLIFFGGIILIFYFLILRPQKKRQQEHQQLVNNLKKSDKVVMSSGIHGRVAALDETTVTVQIAENVQIEVEKSAISSVVPK